LCVISQQMGRFQPLYSLSPLAILDGPKKATVIRLRWLVIITCSYLLLFSDDSLLSTTALDALVLFYVLSGVSLYFVQQKLFDRPLFYSSLVVFDTLFITATLVITQQVETDFYLTYFLVIFLCAIWKDFRWSVAVTGLIACLYGYFLFRDGDIMVSGFALRIPFLLVVSLFYGYFVQLVSLEKTLRVRAEEHAERDALTGLLSRRALDARLEEELARAIHYQRAVSVLIVDVDNFKSVNDTYGHLWGDSVLKTIASCISDSIRQTDVAGRYGGDEFVVVLPETTQEGSLSVAERIRRKIRDFQFDLPDGSFSVSVSIGISSTSEEHYASCAAMLDSADRMMYLAKNAGKDRTASLNSMTLEPKSLLH
jgi:diguanylate cyclase (GGDEF)-like protein